jgi:hypothetical protein
MGPPPIVLIVGFPRSGTTLVRTALGAHPRLCAYPSEADFLLRAGDHIEKEALSREGAVHVVEQLDLEIADEAIRRGIDQVFRRTDRCTFRRVLLSVLKSQCHAANGSGTPLVKYSPVAPGIKNAGPLFPDLKVLHVVRDPRGVVASHAARWPEGGLWYRIRGWKRAVAAAKKWGEAHEERYHQFHYETLLNNPSQCLRSLCEFLGLAYSPEVTDLDYVTWEFHRENAGEKSTRRFRGFDRSKIDQWQEALSAYEVELIESRCAHEMGEFGYEQSTPETSVVFSYMHRLFEHVRYTLAWIRARLRP